MTIRYSTDIAIFGGGIAGLWLLKRLRLEGYRAILIEANTLGSGQTLASQGIIHGGLKYALSGSLTGAANIIADMPARWRRCLQGEDPVDLSGVKVLSDHYYMWSESSFRSRLKTFLGSKSLQGRVEAVDKSAYPEIFANANVDGSLYQLPDFVVDTPSLLSKLIDGEQDAIFRVSPDQVGFQREGDQVTGFNVAGDENEIAIDCQQIILAAGEGNADLIEKCALQSVSTQLRPLHMVYLKQANLPAAFVHCIGDDFSLTPRLTVTSHVDEHGEPVWYLGGELAESGVSKSEEEQIDTAKATVAKYFPWVDVSQAKWTSFPINRAEASADNQHRPDNASLIDKGRVLVTFPTKLTLTPSLADKVVDHVREKGITGSVGNSGNNPGEQLERAANGRAHWE